MTTTTTVACPDLVVFDLDMCAWYPEMYTLSKVPANDDVHRVEGELPNGVGNGVVGVRSGNDIIRLFPGALKALQDLHFGRFPGMRGATASSADTPLAVRIGQAALNILEVVPGVTVRQVLAKGFPDGFDGNIQIGRTPPLSSSKSRSHFPILREKTGIQYSGMLFFDDCGWSDNCGEVMRGCKGVVALRTPNGMTEAEWEEGLVMFAKSRS